MVFRSLNRTFAHEMDHDYRMKKIFHILCAALLCGACSEKTPRFAIGDFASVDTTLSSYEDFSHYAEGLDGFIANDSLAALANPLLLQTLHDCNIPMAPPEEIEARAEIFQHAKRLMDSILSVDTHCDFPELLWEEPEVVSIDAPRNGQQVTIERMRQGHLGAQYLAFWMSPLNDDQKEEKGLEEAPGILWEFIDKLDAHLNEHSDVCEKARTYEEALALKNAGKKAFFYGLENAYWIGKDIRNIGKLAERGVTYITLSHFGDNAVCHSSNESEDPSLGLTDFGREVVEEMNRQGIVIDLSHTSKGTCLEVLERSKAPVVFSHSGAFGVYPNVRNVDDEVLQKVAEKGGVVQVYIMQAFMANLGEHQNVGVKEMVEHICHIVEVAGIDHVGVGLDFDGGGGGVGFRAANDAINLTVALIEKGFSDEEIAKIWGGNYFRVLSEVQAIASR